ncbi:MAG: helical backbone metal receptor [Lentisphaeria bacterium]
MRKFLISALPSLLLLCACRDSKQNDIVPLTIKPDCRRIISLAPAITEMLFALELGDRVVGVSNFCHYPPQVLELPKIGGLLDPNLEAIARLQADCVIVYPNHGSVLEMLKRLKIPVLVAQGDNLPEIRNTMVLLGKTFHRQEKAQQLVREIDQRLDNLRQHLPPKHLTPSVLVVVWRERGQGTLKNLSVAGQDQYFSEMIAAAGGRLLPENQNLDYPNLGTEGILQLNPDLIIEIAPELNDKNSEILTRAKTDWNLLPALKAVKNQQIYLITDDFAAIPGPRCIQLAEKFAEILAPYIHLESKP